MVLLPLLLVMAVWPLTMPFVVDSTFDDLQTGFIIVDNNEDDVDDNDDDDEEEEAVVEQHLEHWLIEFVVFELTALTVEAIREISVIKSPNRSSTMSLNLCLTFCFFKAKRSSSSTTSGETVPQVDMII